MFESLSVMDWAMVVVGLLLVVSEMLPFSAKVKANGIFQGVVNVLKFLKDKVKK